MLLLWKYDLTRAIYNKKIFAIFPVEKKLWVKIIIETCKWNTMKKLWVASTFVKTRFSVVILKYNVNRCRNARMVMIIWKIVYRASSLTIPKRLEFRLTNWLSMYNSGECTAKIRCTRALGFTLVVKFIVFKSLFKIEKYYPKKVLKMLLIYLLYFFNRRASSEFSISRFLN